jgi:hypothetical protein
VTEIAARFYSGAEPPTPTYLASALDVPLRLIFDVLSVLDRHSIVRQVEESHDEKGYLPGKHIGKMTVYDVIGAMREDGATGFAPRADEDSRYLARLVKEAEAANRRVFGEETLERVVTELLEWRAQRRPDDRATAPKSGANRSVQVGDAPAAPKPAAEIAPAPMRPPT